MWGKILPVADPAVLGTGRARDKARGALLAVVKHEIQRVLRQVKPGMKDGKISRGYVFFLKK